MVSQLLLSLGLGLETTGLGLGRECVGLGLECLGLIAWSWSWSIESWIHVWFLPRDAMQARPMLLCGVCLFVCLSVCLSRSYILSKWINISSNFFHPRVAKPFQFFRKTHHGTTPTATPPITGASNLREYKKWLSTNISLYLRNDARQSHSYYGRRIAHRTQAFEWYQFEWPWVTSNPDFKVTILFNVK